MFYLYQQLHKLQGFVLTYIDKIALFYARVRCCQSIFWPCWNGEIWLRIFIWKMVIIHYSPMQWNICLTYQLTLFMWSCDITVVSQPCFFQWKNITSHNHQYELKVYSILLISKTTMSMCVSHLRSLFMVHWCVTSNNATFMVE